jgi:hypothetical protein
MALFTIASTVHRSAATFTIVTGSNRGWGRGPAFPGFRRRAPGEHQAMCPGRWQQRFRHRIFRTSHAIGVQWLRVRSSPVLASGCRAPALPRRLGVPDDSAGLTARAHVAEALGQGGEGAGCGSGVRTNSSRSINWMLLSISPAFRNSSEKPLREKKTRCLVRASSAYRVFAM